MHSAMAVSRGRHADLAHTVVAQKRLVSSSPLRAKKAALCASCGANSHTDPRPSSPLHTHTTKNAVRD